MQATAERAMGGGFRRNSVSELKLKTGVQDPRQEISHLLLSCGVSRGLHHTKLQVMKDRRN